MAVDGGAVRDGLAEAGERRDRAQQAEAEAMEDIARLVAHGRDAGLGVAEMARRAGVSRPTVYDMLDAEAGRS